MKLTTLSIPWRRGCDGRVDTQASDHQPMLLELG